MSNAPEVFRFAVIRSPQSVKSPPADNLPTVEEMGGADQSKAIAGRVEARYRASADEDQDIAGVLADEDPKQVLASLLHFGQSTRLLNDVARHLKAQTTSLSEADISPDGPLLISDRFNAASLIGAELAGERPPELVRKPHFGPVGVGDLRVVEQHLLRYEPGEIAHIENVLATEIRGREHRVMTEREIIIGEELEQTSFMEQDLRSAERFELQTSASDEISQRSQLEAGVNVSASYGPTVEVESSLNYSSDNARQASRQRASSFAQEVTEQAIRRTEEKISRKREERSRTQTEHVNTHRFENNAADSQNISGIYRYVDKVYRMKLVNRGVRFFYEFIVPTPGAYLREIRRSTPSSSLEKPKKPIENVSGINAGNYAATLKRYGIGGIAPPPQGNKVLTEVFSDRDTGDRGPQRFMKEGSLNVPAGYMADSANISIITWEQHKTNPIMELVIGEQRQAFGGSVGGRSNDDIRRDRPAELIEIDNLGEQRESIGYSFFAQHDSTVQVKLEVRCVPTPETILEWKHSVYDAIMDDYRARLSEYNAAVAEEEGAQTLTLDVELPPQQLRKREQDELKRLCLQLMGQESQLADPLHEGGLPFVMEEDEAPLDEGNSLIDVEKLSSLSQEIRFAEQAFEWVNMTFSLYPYYWADEGQWEELLRLEHDDYQHGEFLKAGAARVLVPIRKNFHQKVHAFLVQGPRALDFGDEIEISSPLWLPLYQEIEEAQNPSSQNIAVEKCWDTRVPTNLIWLQPDATLPEYDVVEDCPEE